MDGASRPVRQTDPLPRQEWREIAPAKLNLALHITGQRADGYHTLSSLVAFAETGDSLTVREAEADALTLSGQFAEALRAGAAEENILVKAQRAARAIVEAAGGTLPPLALHLKKSLPVASGIGGGSADAAALLRIVAGLFPGCRNCLRSAALALGADVPMCFDGVPAMVEGLGEVSSPLLRFPATDCVLVNPGIAVSTPAVFRQLASRTNPPLPPVPATGFASLANLVSYLQTSRNDLAAPAGQLVPPIAAIEAALSQAGAGFARMSGSGATVFGLFASPGAAGRAAEILSRQHPGYWVMQTRLRPADTENALT
jgi:4-diphosphocytidyl-2-C-methyl-D-erythritol kinase